MSPVVIPGGCLYEGARNWRVFLVSSIVALIDYGSGNLRSAEKALARAARESATGHEIVVTDKGCRVITLFPAEELPIANRY